MLVQYFIQGRQGNGHEECGLHLQMVENWLYSLFFCAGELWGGVVISVLFWSLANEVCSVSDAKTIYPLMGIAANIALVVSGNYMKWINSTVTQVPTSYF